MEDQLFPRPRIPEGREVHRGERINEEVVPWDGDLDEAELFKIAVQRVRLGIHGDAVVRREMREDFGKRRARIRKRYVWRAAGAGFELGIVQPRSPPKRSCALLWVALSAWMSTSVASSGGSAESWRRRTVMRLNSSG